MARCFRCNKFMFQLPASGCCAKCDSIIAREEAELLRKILEEHQRIEEEERKEEEERRRKEAEERRIYPHVLTLKQMFAAFFPVFKAIVVRDDEAWRIVDINHMLWAHDAIDLKREGKYVDACKLYFDHVLQLEAITLGWAKGIFKTLAAAGDIADAVSFGLYWYKNLADNAQRNTGDPVGHMFDSDDLVSHLGSLLTLVRGQAIPISFPDYLKEISGNPNYSIDMKKTDLYTDETLRNIRNNV